MQLCFKIICLETYLNNPRHVERHFSVMAFGHVDDRENSGSTATNDVDQNPSHSSSFYLYFFNNTASSLAQTVRHRTVR